MLPLRLALVAVALAGQFIVPRPPAASGVFAGSDTFSSALDTANWTVIDREGDTSNSELECYKPANQTVSAGNLVLTIQSQSVTCNTHSYSFTSSMIQWKTYNFTYGTVEFSGRMPGGGGTWPSVWLLGSNCQSTNPITADNSGSCVWPNPGSDEIDIVDFNFSAPTQVDQRIHTAGGAPGCSPGLTDASANTHVYRFEWSAGHAVWKIDGSITCDISTNVPTTPMFLILNIAAHNSVSGLPQTMIVDYVTLTQ